MPRPPVSPPSSPSSVGEYTISSRIGRGSYANVYKGFKKRGNYEVVAIKCIQVSALSASAKDNLINEIGILRKIKHKNVVEMRDFTWDSRNIYLIFDYCPGGNLAEFIKTKKRLSEFTVQHFVQQLAHGLEFLHAGNIVHCDLKPENILLSKPPVGSYRSVVLKIADFGFSQILKDDQRYTYGLKGSPLYMAPEILRQQPYDGKADLYSLGVITYECLFGSAPFRTDDFHLLIKQILSDDKIVIPDTVDLSENCRDFIEGLLVKDPEKRLSFSDFFEHAFIDLKHYPCVTNYYKGVDLITQAVLDDGDKNYDDALEYYTEGLLYLIPAYNWLDAFNDRQRKMLGIKIEEYVSRAEIIIQTCPRTRLIFNKFTKPL